MFRIFITLASGWNQWWAVVRRAGVCRVKAAAAASVETAGSAPCPCHLSSHSAVLQCSSALVFPCGRWGWCRYGDNYSNYIYNYLRRIYAPTFILRPCWCRYCCRPGYDGWQGIVYYVGSWLITQLQWVEFSNLDINEHQYSHYFTLFIACLHNIYWWSVWFAYNSNHPSTKTCRQASQILSICLNVKIVWVWCSASKSCIRIASEGS